MNVIIVDDAIQTVKAIKLSINWSKLGIFEVYTANNIYEAKEIIENHDINIIISDIEMPEGSGLELIKWIKNNSSNTESILLTCHEEFQYAKTAIELGSFEYLVKPVPFDKLEETISRLIIKMEIDNKIKKQSAFWVENQTIIEEKFWTDVIKDRIPEGSISIEKEAGKRDVAYDKNAKYLMILLSKKRIRSSLENWDIQSLGFVLKNIASEIILHDLKEKQMIQVLDKIVIIISSNNNIGLSNMIFKERCIEYIILCNRYLGCNISAYIGEYVFGYELQEIYRKLEELDNNNVSLRSKVYDLNSEKINQVIENKVVLPNLNDWVFLLNNEQKEYAIKEVKKFIDKLERDEKMNAKILNVLYQDIMQMLYSYLEQKGIQAHQLFDDDKSVKLYTAATKSTDGILSWIEYAFDKAVNYVNEVIKSKSVISKVKEFIDNNYDKDITRDDIANYVFLNPDYLTRIFKKSTGLSICEYLTELRIKNSKKLLVSSDLSITEIATKIGYNNINYFSKIFKKSTDITPIEYRKKSRGYV